MCIMSCSFFWYSTLSLTSEDVDSAEFNVARTFGSFSDVSRGKLCDNGHSSDKPLSPKQKHLQRLHNTGVHSSPASLAGSLTDIPVLLVNGAPQPDSQICPQSPGLQTEISVTEPFSPQSKFKQSRAVLKLVRRFYIDFNVMFQVPVVMVASPQWSLSWTPQSFGFVHISAEQMVQPWKSLFNLFKTYDRPPEISCT